MLSPGDRVKDYEVIAPLRSGGMAMLYLARRRGVGGFSRLVALKLVHPHLVRDETIHQLFLNEARISAAVAHPNVVNVEEIGQTGDSYFIVMEYVHGVSLSELLMSLREQRLRMSQKLCVWVVAQIAEALHAVHEATGENGVPLQIVHHDVSPQNVLIGHTGHVKLIDFGIAKSHLLGQSAASGIAVLGKPGYMAPEQLQSQAADRRTDVYALGVMLWEMLTSQSLFRCQRLDDERDWALRERPVPPSRFSCSSPALDEVVLKALAPDPRDRFESAFEFRAALLKADASALLVDAPTFAALMRSMLGQELERQRAKLPSEVSVQLDRDAEAVTSRAVRVEELTADMGTPEALRERIDGKAEADEDRPTLVEAPAARRGEQTADLPSAEVTFLESTDSALGPLAHVPTLVGPRQAEIVTMSAPIPKLPSLRRTSRVTRRERTLRATWVGAVCLFLGMALGAAVSGKDVAPQQPVVLRIHPAAAAEHVSVKPPEPAPERAAPLARRLEERRDASATRRTLSRDGATKESAAREDDDPRVDAEKPSARKSGSEHRRRSERTSRRTRTRHR